MPLVGGGGAGNIAGGANPAGTGSGLNYVGNHCYAYSGVIASSGSQSAATDTTLLFTTGSEYITCVMAWGNNQTSGTADNFIQINMDGQAIYQIRFKEGADSNETNPKNLYLLIPPFTKFETLVGTSGDPSNWTITLRGRIYA
jgi:hypothetical protein